MTETKDKAHRYFAIVYAALVILAVAIAGFVYSLLKTTPEDLAPETVEYNNEEVPSVDPSGSAVPSGPPNVPPPTYPPPNN
ncbi:hypothetical protein GF366_05070 [Candidatus Peregrinibacteria bacterium]|nr:hypothetical protein [Candidatus Peregrinibacteria bacterium]